MQVIRRGKSLSSLSTLAVGTTLLGTTRSVGAFTTTTTPLPASCLAHPTTTTTALFLSTNTNTNTNTNYNNDTMTSTVASSNAAAAFLAANSPGSTLLADPSVLLGSATKETAVPASAFVTKPPPELVDDTDVLSGLFGVPPSKSLRTRLNLPPATTTTTTSRTPTTFPRIVGHRGSLYEELENTRPAFLACEGVCHAVELDVFLLKDGTLVVFHGSGTDANPGLLDLYCTHTEAGATSILDLTFEETQQLIFNPNYEELAAPTQRVLAGKIPTLEQVLMDMKPTGMEVLIELKGLGTARPVVELVERLDMVDQVSFSSFNHQEIETVRRLRPQINPHDGTYIYKTGALFDGPVPPDFIQRAQKVQASEVHLRYDTCTTDRIRAIHQAGMKSMAWFRGPIGMKSDVETKFWDIGNEDSSCYQTVMETGVQQLCVNKPKVLYEYLQSQQAQQQKQKQQVNNMIPQRGLMMVNEEEEDNEEAPFVAAVSA